MKNKVIISIFLIITLLNIGFSAYLWKQNKELQSDVSAISSTLDRLDLDALEKIQTPQKEFDAEKDCGTGMWDLPCE